MLEAKKEILKLIEGETGERITSEELEYSEHADVSSSVCFRLAKRLGKSPVQVAEEFARKIKPSGFIELCEAKNGFLNFFLDYEKFGVRVLAESLKEGFGRGAPKKKKIVLEHTSVNPSGPVHVGRLRNSIIGDSLRRILSYSGFPVETRYWVNDVGKQVAIIALTLDKDLNFSFRISEFDELKERYQEYEGKDDFEIFFEYVVGNKLYETDEKFKEAVEKLIKDAESGDKNQLEKIKKAARICLKGQQQTYGRLGFVFDCFDFESEEIESGRVFKVLDELRKTEYWTSKDDVGEGLDLSSLGIEKRSGLSVLTRSDGTTVYLARDISYHLRKLSRGDILINVLGEDHKLEFEELSKILKEILKVKKPVEVVHFSFVSFEGEKLSTRKGKTAPVDMLLDEAESKAAEEIIKRGIAEKETAPQIGVGAVKYHLLKTAPAKPITFRWEEALSFDGDAAPYIQYAHARSARILEKSGLKSEEINAKNLDLSNLQPEEKNLIKELSLLPEKVASSAVGRKPHLLANYLYELASSYSRFYKECQVLSDDEALMKRRLALVAGVKNTLKTGLSLLGIDSPERM
jgi:arginyl-tRNA synthetase